MKPVEFRTQPGSAENLLSALQTGMTAGKIDRPDLEARWIVENILKCDYSKIRAGLAPAPSPEQSQKALSYLNARLAGAPLAHILGYTEFYGLRFKVAPGVLVPRPETELLVDTALGLIDEKKWNEPWLLDCYTGCGNVLLSVMANRPGIHGAGIDIDPVSLTCAEMNRDTLACLDAIFVHGKVEEVIDGLDKDFQIVTANPPYIPTAEIPALQPEISRNENIAALDGGEDGLDHLRVLSKLAGKVLSSDGFLLSEIGAGQRAAVEEIFSNWVKVDFVSDLQDHDRILIACRQDR